MDCRYVSIDKDSQLHNDLVKKCQENMWLKTGGVYFKEDPFLEHDSPYSFAKVESIENLRDLFWKGCWSIRQGFIYKDLAFINQVPGGDEWWTLKYDSEKNEWVSFESVSFRIVIEYQDFDAYIERLEKATVEQCKSLTY